MEQYKKHFLELLRYSVKNEEKPKTDIQIDDGEWADLIKMASIHHVLPMIYDAVGKTKAFENVSSQIKEPFRKQAIDIVIMQTNNTKNFLKVYEKLQNAGVTALIVKGLVCRSMYDNPDFRISGDEDILIEESQFAECDCLLLENGFCREDTDINNPDYETRYVNKKTGVQIEVHTSLLPKDNSAFSEMNNEFRQAFARKKELIIEETKIYTLDYTLHFLYLLCHSVKHFVFRGVGIRQLCDIIKMAEIHGNEIDWDYITEASKKYKMYTFMVNLFDIAEKYLGFYGTENGCPEFEDMVPDSENLLEDMLESGAYGKSSPGREHSTNITMSAAEQAGRKSKGIISLNSSLFPPKKYMEQRYLYVKKHKWLLPVAWCSRILEYCKKMRVLKKIGASDINSVEIGRKRTDLLKQYSIIDK